MGKKGSGAVREEVGCRVATLIKFYLKSISVDRFRGATLHLKLDIVNCNQDLKKFPKINNYIMKAFIYGPRCRCVRH